MAYDAQPSVGVSSVAPGGVKFAGYVKGEGVERGCGKGGVHDCCLLCLRCVLAAASIDVRCVLGVRPGACVAAVLAVIDEEPVAVGVS
jgi:hypothetical protein